jgi:cysteine desulfurase/selenocysteine lyase
MPAEKRLDPLAIQADFPILARNILDKKLVYLDNAATSQKPAPVIQALEHFYKSINANVHRSVHTLGEEATAAYEHARARLATFINAREANSVVFTRNTTEAINLVAATWGYEHIEEGDEILVTEMEHHSNLLPWQVLAGRKKASLRYLPVERDHTLNLQLLQEMLSPKTRIVCCSHVSNVLGTINDVRKIGELAHAMESILVVDAAQSAPLAAIDVQAMGCDFLAFSGHKMMGPTGIGVLYGKTDLLQQMAPYQAGGEMVTQVWKDRATWADPPTRFEAGTPDIAGAVALGAAADYISQWPSEDILQHERTLALTARAEIEKIEGITTYCPHAAKSTGILSFNVRGIHPHDVAAMLDEMGIAIRAGHHCAQPLMRSLGIEATARASFYIYNTADEVDVFIDALRQVIKRFNG